MKVSPVINDFEVLSKAAFKENIVDFENQLKMVPGAMFGDSMPLEHIFTPGLYVRQIIMPRGMLITSKIHKHEHPYFVMQGDVSVLTEDGPVSIKAPYIGVTKAGTKRVLYIHEDTIWVTVHKTDKTDLEDIEDEIIAKNFNELDGFNINIAQLGEN